VGAFADVAAAATAAARGDDDTGPWAVVAFDAASAEQLRYTIHMRGSVLPATDTLLRPAGYQGDYLRYVTSGFLSLQRAIDEAALDASAPGGGADSVNATAGAAVWATPFPVAAQQRNGLSDASGALLALLLCLGLAHPLGSLAHGVAHDCERRGGGPSARQLMRAAGMHHIAWAGAWAASYAVMLLGISALAALMLATGVFPHSEASVIWTLVAALMLSCVPLGFLVAALSGAPAAPPPRRRRCWWLLRCRASRLRRARPPRRGAPRACSRRRRLRSAWTRLPRARREAKDSPGAATPAARCPPQSASAGCLLTPRCTQCLLYSATAATCCACRAAAPQRRRAAAPRRKTMARMLTWRWCI
jgi:hypothetical protein